MGTRNRIWQLALTAAVAVAGAQDRPGGAARPTVGVFLKFEKPAFASALKPLRQAVEDVFRPTGLDLRWTTLGARPQPAGFDRAVMVEVRGRCTPFRIEEVAPADETRTLGWTHVEDGQVSPFVMVDCDEIARVLRGQPGTVQGRGGIYSRFWHLAARVMAHELLHALLGSVDHYATDCTRALLRNVDLRTPARLAPAEVAALRRIGRDPGTALAGQTGQRPDAKRPAAGQ